MSKFSPFSFKNWIDENPHLLKPPVGNKPIWTETNDFIVMVVGGPNSRTDFHYNESEEFFYQLEGDMVLRLIEDGKPVDVPIKEGEIFLLPGLVVEKVRQPGMTDGLLWYCPKCGSKVYEEYFFMTNIATQMQPVFQKFYGSEELRTCKNCGNIHPKPGK